MANNNSHSLKILNIYFFKKKRYIVSLWFKTNGFSYNCHDCRDCHDCHDCHECHECPDCHNFMIFIILLFSLIHEVLSFKLYTLIILYHPPRHGKTLISSNVKNFIYMSYSFIRTHNAKLWINIKIPMICMVSIIKCKCLDIFFFSFLTSFVNF